MIKVVKLDSEGDPTGEQPKFEKVEAAQKWCEAERGEKLEWGEENRFFSLEGMTEAEVEHLGGTGEYPPIRFWIVGLEEDGTDRELEDEDFETQGEAK
jgi:hypothetical protein